MLLPRISFKKNCVCMHVPACVCVCMHTSEDQRTILWSSLHSWIWVPGIELRLSGLPGKRLYQLNHLTGPQLPLLTLFFSSTKHIHFPQELKYLFQFG